MTIFGFTQREWILLGIGSAVQGALMGLCFRSPAFIVLNLLCLALDVYLLGNTGSPE